MKRIMKRTGFILLAFALLFSHIFSASALGAVEREEGRIIFLLYHDLCAGKIMEDDDPAYTTTDEKFEHDIRVLLSMGYDSLSLEQYYNKEYKEDGNYFVITFDDGYLSNYELAYPIMKKLGVYGDIFINTESVKFPHHFSYDQAREMEESGVVKIYSHLATHSRATEMKREVFLKMAKSAYEEIERELGERNRFLAYPYSDHDKVTSEIAKSLGTKLQFVQVTDSRVDGVYYNTVKRVNISYTDDIREVVEAYFK